jgi:hypothetical protein
MATRKPIVLVSGFLSELFPGDYLEGVLITSSLTAGSGLVGGGNLSSSQRVDVSLAAAPSGLIFVGNQLGLDGAAQASGNAALSSAATAQASGNAALSSSATALASGNAALPRAGGTMTGGLTLTSGTTSLSPLNLQPGANLTNATAGAIEYDGRVVYSTPAGRGVSPSMMLYRLESGLVGSNVNTAQAVFGVGVTLAANTVYAFDYNFTMTKTAGATAHTAGLGFSGTATINNIYYAGAVVSVGSTLPNVTTTNSVVTNASASNFTTGGSISTSVAYRTFVLNGTVSINASGTFIPQYTLSAAPGGAYTTIAGSYFAIWPIGAAGANTSVGPWA